jgi:hypothetical protein
LPSGIGSPAENPVVLTHQDRRGGGSWGSDTYYPDAYWPVEILAAGDYWVTLDLYSFSDHAAPAELRVGGQIFASTTEKGTTEVEFPRITLLAGEVRLSARVFSQDEWLAPRFVTVERLRE